MKINFRMLGASLKAGIEKVAPGVMIAVGIGAVAVGAYKAAEAAPEAKEAIAEFKTMREAIEQSEEDPEARREIINSGYRSLGNTLLHAYAKPALLVSGGTALILGGHGIISKKLATTTASLISTDKLFQDYRHNVIEDQGEEADFRYRTGVKKVNVETVEQDIRGRKRKVMKEYDVVDEVLTNPFMKFYDESNPNFSKNPTDDLYTLRKREEWFNDRLRAEGYLFLNDVLYDLGFNRCAEGSVYGWVYDPDNPDVHNCVDLGIRDIRRKTIQNAINGYEPVILLNFNVDGVIIDKLPRFGQYGN